MNLSYFLLFSFLFFQPVYSFQKLVPIQKYKNVQCYNNFKKKNINQLYSTNKNIITKIHSYSNLIRSINIIPTLFLTFSGGFILEPSILNLLHSNQFLLANLISLLTMSLSMVINDIFDIELDKINNPTRPLVIGEITQNEALKFSIFLLLFIEGISTLFLPDELAKIVNIVIYFLTLYTPFIKKMPLIKNLFCAFVVAFTVYFCGIAISPVDIIKNVNYSILLIAIRYIFLGSFMVELLLDIYDIEGDKEKNINTLPVLIGKEKVWYFICCVIGANIYNIASLFRFHLLNPLLPVNNIYFMIFLSLPIILFIPTIINVYNIKKNKFDKEFIKLTVKNTTFPMFLTLLFLNFLAYQNSNNIIQW
jgi:geranylgeranylglycerol-phosphate geranylgeranyltransferase